ncbi:MAG: hypothetical protein LBH90_05860, partial [Tannerella sp.]|nr:hypothetical protein [Tannerella sp.]
PLRFNKTIVRKQKMKFALQMFRNIKQVKMFQTAKTAIIKTNHKGNNFSIRHGKGAISMPFTIIGMNLVFFDFF